MLNIYNSSRQNFGIVTECLLNEGWFLRTYLTTSTLILGLTDLEIFELQLLLKVV